MIAFISYGFFWWSLVFIICVPAMGYAEPPNEMAMACYLFIWGVFSFGMWIATLKKAPWALSFVFLTVWILFFLLASANWTGNKGCLKAAGIEGVICGLSAIYVAFGEILNDTYGRTILPLGLRD